MKKTKRVAAGLGYGVAMGVSVLAFGKWTESQIEKPSQINPGIEACAAQLGTMAMDAAVLPEACNGYKGSIDQTVVNVDVINHGSLVSRTSTVTYHLPTAAEFSKDRLLTEAVYQERVNDQTHISEVGGGIALVIGFAIGYGQMTKPRQEAAQQEAPMPTVA